MNYSKAKGEDMKSCLNCYNSLVCMMRTPEKRKKCLDNDTTCLNWEDDSVDWDGEDEGDE